MTPRGLLTATHQMPEARKGHTPRQDRNGDLGVSGLLNIYPGNVLDLRILFQPTLIHRIINNKNTSIESCWGLEPMVCLAH